MTSCIAREKQGYAVYNMGTSYHKQAYYQVFHANMILQFSTDYSCFKISVQTVPLARRAHLSHGKNVLQHALRAQAVERSWTISLPKTSITKLLREFERAHLNEQALREYLGMLPKIHVLRSRGEDTVLKKLR